MLEQLRTYTNSIRNKRARKYHRETTSYIGALIISFYDMAHLCLYSYHWKGLRLFKEPIKAIKKTYKYRKTH